METIKVELVMIAVPFVVAILGITFPLLQQTIARIDEKYKSTRIVEVFYMESKSVCFRWLLKISISIFFISSIVLAILHLLKEDIAWLNLVLFIFSLLSTISLIVTLFLYSGLIKEYTIPMYLFKRLENEYNRLLKKQVVEKSEQTDSNNNRHLLFNALSELLYYSIRKQDEELVKELYRFMAEYIVGKQNGNAGKVVVYDDAFYSMLFEATEIISSSKKKTISYNNGNTLLQLLFDNYFETIISEKTYSSIWNTLNQQLRFDRDDLIMSYWVFAHQYPQYYMQEIYPNTKYENDKFFILNEDEVKLQKSKRERFFEFHYVFGGLVLSLEKYNLLGKIIKYTNQQPPKYILVPSSLSELLERYILYSEDHLKPFYFESRYPFPDTSSVSQNGIVIMWIQKYLAVLFLRQYVAPQSYGRSKLNLPRVPDSLEQMNKWIENLEILKIYINKIIKNRALLEAVDLPIKNNKWFRENKVSSPEQLINTMIDSIKEKYKSVKAEQKIDPKKEDEFKEISKTIIRKSIEDISGIFSENKHKEEIIFPLSLNVYNIIEKGAFATEQDKGYINFDSSSAQAVAINYKYKATWIFNRFIKRTYLLEQKDIFYGIDKLSLDAQKHVIICFGVNLDYHRESLGVRAIKRKEGSYTYKNITIIDLEYNMLGLDPDSFIIISKKDLPRVEFHDQEENKFKLPVIDEEYHIKAAIININENKDILEEISVKNPEQSALASIEFNPLVIWNKHAKCIYIKTYHQFGDNTLPQSLDEVTLF